MKNFCRKYSFLFLIFFIVSCSDDDSITDADNDGIADSQDSCPSIVNPDQLDSDEDGTGDVCDETPFPLSIMQACIDGMAGEYSCLGYDLQDFIPLSEMDGAASANDIWGWKDENSGREFILIGTNANTTFVELNIYGEAEVIGYLPRATEASSRDFWRDIKVSGHYAFIISESFTHGLQIFDLERLLEDYNDPQTFTMDAHYTGFGAAHNLAVNPTQPYLYILGSRDLEQNLINSGGPLILDISNPLNPTVAGGFAGHLYSHDAQIVTYDGPDADYAGKEIFFGSNEKFVSILDVTDKENPVAISQFRYPNTSYTHQGWLTDDQTYFIFGDELDERSYGVQSRSIIVDVSDLENPVIETEYIGPSAAIDHNGYIRGDIFYLANYSAGFREIDVSTINNPVETAYFDTYPADNNPDFNGLWSVYPFFDDERVVAASDINRGLFILYKKD